MLYIGCHLSASKGYKDMGKQALSIDANTFAFFTRNPRGGSAKEISSADVEAFLKIADENKFGKLVAHAPYTMNCCAADEHIREFAVEMLTDDLKRMEFTPDNYYNFHPGSHVKQGADVGIKLISEALNTVLMPQQSTTVLLETMAGKGTELGRNFQRSAEALRKSARLSTMFSSAKNLAYALIPVISGTGDMILSAI